MKTILTIILLLTSIKGICQVDLKHDFSMINNEIIILSSGLASFGVMILNKPKTEREFMFKKLEILAIIITTGVIIYQNDRIEVNSSGINFKLKYKKFKCKN